MNMNTLTTLNMIIARRYDKYDYITAAKTQKKNDTTKNHEQDNIHIHTCTNKANEINGNKYITKYTN